MKIAVCGSGKVSDDSIAGKAFDIGIEVAGIDAMLLTGACGGYPNEAAKGAFSKKGKVIGISPARGEKEHIKKYLFPTGNFTRIEYTSLGIPARNYALIKEADAIILISGQIGSLNEFTLAFHSNKVIGVLENSSGITGLIRDIAKICDKKGESDNIVYSSDAKEIVSLVVNKLNQ